MTRKMYQKWAPMQEPRPSCEGAVKLTTVEWGMQIRAIERDGVVIALSSPSVLADLAVIRALRPSAPE